jgi:hypothetical protein
VLYKGNLSSNHWPPERVCKGCGEGCLLWTCRTVTVRVWGYLTVQKQNNSRGMILPPLCTLRGPSLIWLPTVLRCHAWMWDMTPGNLWCSGLALGAASCGCQAGSRHIGHCRSKVAAADLCLIMTSLMVAPIAGQLTRPYRKPDVV